MNNQSLERISNFYKLRELPSLILVDFRNVYEPFDPFGKFKEYTKVGNIGNFSFEYFSGEVFMRDSFPRIFFQMFYSERETFLFFVNIEDNSLNFLSFFIDLARMFDLLGPGEVRNVD